MTEQPRKRQRRDQRVTTPPSMTLTERDKRIIEAVYQYRVLTQSQIQHLFFSQKTSAQRRLQLLYHHGFLERQFLPVRGGIMNSPILYLLDKRGAEMLTAEFGYDEVHWKREHNEVSADFLEHALAINEFRILIVLACKRLTYPLLTWRGENEMKADYDRVKIRKAQGGQVSVSLIPDSHFVIDTPRQAEKTKAFFFLELDRGSMVTKRFKTKIEAYMEYVESGAYERKYGTRGLRVLTVALSQGRLQSLRQVTEEAGGRNRFWFAVLSELTSENIIDKPVWQVAGREGLSTLIEL
jgi:hypothetical protein